MKYDEYLTGPDKTVFSSSHQLVAVGVHADTYYGKENLVIGGKFTSNFHDLV